MTIQEKHEGMVLLKAELLKKWRRRQTKTATEFRLMVTEAMELATARLIEEQGKESVFVPFDSMQQRNLLK